jgi:molybdopterin-guanine dinucleotide biosynthesis protein A
MQNPLTAIVLAADRSAADPVAAAAGVACKALAPVGGVPMVLRVLDALDAAAEVDGCLLCGPPAGILEREPRLRDRLGGDRVRWIPPQATPSASAMSGLETIPEGKPVLLTTGDHALLTAPVVDHFCREARGSGCDVVAALALHAQTAAAFPGMRRTRTRFKDGPYCGCNLYAFLTPRGRSAAALWRRVENQRKKPIKMLGELGWAVVLRYVLGRLTLRDALREVSRRMQLEVGAVVLPFPEAAVDVDSVADWRAVQAVAEGRR